MNGTSCYSVGTRTAGGCIRPLASCVLTTVPSSPDCKYAVLYDGQAALGCLCRFGQCARHPSIHGPLLVLCQRPWVSSLSFHMEVRKGPVPISPLDSHLIGQHQSLVWVRVPAPSWLSLFPGSTWAPLCVLQHRGLRGD